MADDPRNKSIERAKTSGRVLATMGLNAVLPGAGTMVERLGSHIIGLVTDARLARLEDFHRRVFEGEVNEDEINNRFRTMDDGDFQHLLSAMLTDIEAEKMPLYAAVYIHLVERADKLATYEKRNWVLAAAALHIHDYWVLGEIASGRWDETLGADSEQRLILTNAVQRSVRLVYDRMPHSGDSAVPEEVEMVIEVTATDFGKELLAVLAGALKEVETRD